LDKFEEMGYDIVNLTINFFLTLFTQCLPERESLKVLDLYLLEGMHNSKLFYELSLAYLRVIED
jgi:hypothetical protein